MESADELLGGADIDELLGLSSSPERTQARIVSYADKCMLQTLINLRQTI